MAFSNNRLLFCSHGKGGFAIGNSGTQLATVVLHGIHRRYSRLHHEQTIFGEEMHTLITFMVSVMVSNTVDGL